MASLVKNYNFGFPLTNLEQLDALEQNLLTDDQYTESLVSLSLTKQFFAANYLSMITFRCNDEDKYLKPNP